MINKILIDKFNVTVGDTCVPATSPFSLATLSGVVNDIALYSESFFVSEAFVSDALLAQPYAYLILSGFNSDDTVYFNGVELACEKGSETECCFNVKELLLSGINTIKITPSALPSTADELDKIGAFSPSTLVFFDTAYIHDVLTDYTIDDNGTLTVDIILDALGTFESSNAIATLVSPAGQYYYGSISEGRGQIVITEPLLWSPLGIGVPNLYKLTVTLYCGGEFEDTFEVYTGYRSVTASERVPIVNGKTFVIKGAVYKNSGISCGNHAAGEYETLVLAASTSGINTFMIKDTRFISEDFFSLCDKRGVAVIVEGNIDDYTASRHPSVIAVFGEWGMKYAGLNMDRSAPWDYELINIAPSLSSFKRIRSLVPADDMNLFSRAFENCDEAFLRNVSLVTNIASEYRFVSDIRLLSYLSGVCVGEEILRSTATRDKAFSLNVVASSFNSLSPIISDGLVDHLGMPKAALSFLKEAYGETQVYSCRDSDGTAMITLCNNGEIAVNGTLKWSLLNNENAVCIEESVEISLDPNSDSTVRTADLSEYIKDREEECYLLCEITSGVNTLSRSVMLFSKTKYFKFKDPCITANITRSGKGYIITLSANRFAHRVQLGFKNVDGSFSDNFFDITSDAPRRVVFTPLCCTTEENLINELEIISMYDIR